MTARTNKRMGGRLDGRHYLFDLRFIGRKEGIYLPNDDGCIMQQKNKTGRGGGQRIIQKSAISPALYHLTNFTWEGGKASLLV